MTLLHVNDLCKEYQERLVLRDVSFRLTAGDRVGLVGMNGGGKSTLMRILAGLEVFDYGDIQWLNAGARKALAYLPQQPSWRPDVPLAAHLDGVDMDTLSRCGISTDLLTRPTGLLSGGETTRAALAKAVHQNPELLLLDEPTNHLDVDGLMWLESFLSEFRGTVLVVSHDRYFLDQVVHRILDLEDGSIREYRGNYSAYTFQKEAERRQQEEAYQQFVREKRRLKEALERKRQWAEKGQKQARKMRAQGVYDAPIGAKGFYGTASKRMMSGAKALEQRLDRLHAEKPKSRISIDASLGDVVSTGRHLVVAENVGFHYSGEKWLFRQARFFVERGDKVAVVGSNGSGKSTLVRILLGKLAPSEGTVRVSPVRLGYLEQNMKTLQPTDTLLDSVRREERSALATNRARDILGHMLFTNDWVFRRVDTLSGGEKVRLAFARVLFDTPDVLMLDEPTNGLDLPSREAIEQALLAFPGTIIFVSHDRFLLHRLATKVLSLQEGTLRMTLGGYDNYLMWRDSQRSKPERNVIARPFVEDGMLQDGVNLRDRKLILETRLAVLSQQLAAAGEEDSERLTEEFIRIQREVRQLAAHLKR